MLWLSILCGVLLWLLWRLLQINQDDLDHIPGPPVNIWWDLITRKEEDQFSMHRSLAQLAKVYGSVFKIRKFGGSMVFVSGFDAIHQVMLTKEFGGRDSPYRMSAVYKDTGIVHMKPNRVWKTLRKAVQQHLKQFGEGMSKLEDVIVRISDEVMFTRFAANTDQPFSPNDIIRETSLRTLIFLICGDLSEEGYNKLIECMKEYFILIRQCHPAVGPLSFQLLDAFPWLRYFGVGPGRIIDETNKVKDVMWKILEENHQPNPGAESIMKVFQEYQEKDKNHIKLSTDDLKSTCVLLTIAGNITTTDTFFSFMNILAHRQHVQDTILEEIKKVTGGKSQVLLSHRPQMHYTRATLLETLRYTSTVALGVGRRVETAAKLQDILIPKETKLITNLFELHNDPEFWGDPELFRPERFLDDKGEVVPADHKYRRHLMPFGAGLRVCVAEALAMSRLFLWMSSLVQRFEVLPAPGNEKSSSNNDNFIYDGILCSRPYEIILKDRLW